MSKILERLRSRLQGDSGTTLMELIVGMALTMIFGGIFTTAIVSMTSTSNKAQALANTSSQLSSAYLRLDKTIRYASAISTPGQSTGAGSTGDWYVEIQTTNTGTAQCSQFRVEQTAQQLQVRTWTPVNSVATGLTSWLPLASYITNGGASSTSPNVPFSFPTALASVNFQQLQINLTSISGNPVSSSSSSITFPAINSSTSATNSTVCQEAGRP